MIHDYAAVFDMMQDRKTNIDKKIQSLLFSNKMVKSISIIQEDEILGDSLKITSDEFYASDVFTQLQASKSTMWFYDLFDTKNLFVLRNLKSINTGKDIGVLVLQVDKIKCTPLSRHDF